jgi:hypothetical protein
MLRAGLEPTIPVNKPQTVRQPGLATPPTTVLKVALIAGRPTATRLTVRYTTWKAGGWAWGWQPDPGKDSCHEIWRSNSQILQLVEASEEGKGPRRAVEPMMISHGKEWKQLHRTGYFLQVSHKGWKNLCLSKQLFNCHRIIVVTIVLVISYYCCYYWVVGRKYKTRMYNSFLNNLTLENAFLRTWQSLIWSRNFKISWCSEVNYRAHKSPSEDPVSS